MSQVELTTLGKSCEFFNGKAHEKDIDVNGKYIVVNSKFISQEGRVIKRTKEQMFPLYKDDIVMVMSDVPNGKALAKCFIVDKDDTYSLNQRICCIRSKQFDTKYLYYQLNRNENFLAFNNGENQTNLRKDDILDCPLIKPSMDEQRRMVAELDEALTGLNHTSINISKNLENCDELFQTTLEHIFEKTGQGWPNKTLGEVAQTNGRIGWKGLTAKEYTKEGPLFLSVHSLNYGDYVDLRDAFHISIARYDESPEIMLQKNDILICKDGAGIGKLGIVPNLTEKTTINSSLLLIRCKSEILPKYLYYNLLSPSFQYIVQSRLMGATTPHLYQRDIVTFPIKLPSVFEQEGTIAMLDDLNQKIKDLRIKYELKIINNDLLKDKILKRVFENELIETE